MKPEIKRYLAWSAIGLAVAAGLAWSFWPQAVPAEIAFVTRGPMRVEVTEEGRTRAREIYQVSAPVAGKLLRIQNHAGDVVKSGQIVASLLPTVPSFLDMRSRAQAEAAVRSAEAARSLAAADLERAKAELAYAVSDLRRVSALAAVQAAAQSELDRAQLARNTKTAQQATAQAALRVKEFELQTARALLIDPANLNAVQRDRASIALASPAAGMVLRVLHENESVVTVGTPILEVGDPAQIEVVVDLVSADAVKVREGAEASLTDWGGSKTLAARVRRVEPSGFTKVSALGIEEQRVNVLLDFTGPLADRAAIADGYRVVAHIVIWESPNVIQVPVQAMFRQGNNWAVYAVRGGRAELTPIRIGHVNDHTAEVLAGLKEKDEVIAHPSDRIANGVKVVGQNMSR